jgi:hypothetical protein
MAIRFDPGEEVAFDVTNYGSGRGHVAGYYTLPDGTNLVAVYPKSPKISKNDGYICLIVPEKDLISTPF